MTQTEKRNAPPGRIDRGAVAQSVASEGSRIRAPQMSASPPSILREDPANHRICQVCGDKAHGIHFQVISCRACAAFFRRSADSSHRYKCRQKTNNCDVSKSAPQNCRLCRFKKCRSVGMTHEGLIQNVKYETFPSEPSSVCPVVSDPTHSRVYFNENEVLPGELPHVTFENNILSYETEHLKDIVQKVLEQPYWSNHGNHRYTPLQCLIKSFNEMMPATKPSWCNIAYRVDLRFGVHFLSVQMERIAKWAMECEPFAQLPYKDKLKMYYNFWHTVHTLERVKRTMDYFDKDVLGSVFLVTDTTAVDLTNFSYYLPNVPEEKWKQINTHFKELNDATIQNFLIPIRELNLTTFEVVYLCLFLMWNHKKLDLSSHVSQIAEEILDRASSELHDYYVNELRISNYVSRLSKLMKLLSSMDAMYRHSKEITITADIDNVCSIDPKVQNLTTYASNL
ncbi:hypothetical protein L596_011929 [Steinernema carpocapsae]|uniref:Nuclear receptor domain-containing protein n=1 Tax=Steinernema carpocapsae TaxID=34508 RepID=A0A4U5NVW8_STECR|nr:hypothetical protein L596_011929 [Steinernema carpocapsae]